MKKILGILFLILLLSSTSFAGIKKGKGEVEMSDRAVETFITYLRGKKGKKPSVFILSSNGSYTFYWYCAHSGGCADGNYEPTIRECEEKTGVDCGLFARKRTIVWNNDINPGKGKVSKINSKWSDTEIRAKLTELGFIGNTSTTTKDNYDYPSLIAKQRSIHKSNWRDYVDYNNKFKSFVMAITKTKNDMTFGWQTDDTSWNDVIKKSFDRCNKYIKQKPKNYPKDSICILYYKGTTPTTDKEKIETAQKYYSQAEVERFFEKYPYILNDLNNSLLKKSKITKKITQSNNDIVSKLKDLKELLDSGVLTNEEFEKAKKKLLN